MSALKRTRPMSSRWLLGVVVFQALSGLFGGIMLVLDPSGKMLGTPIEMLNNTPFKTFLIPGLLLLIVLGVFPAIISFALWSKPNWKALERLEHLFSEHWSWIGAGVVGVGLLVWLAVELWMVGYSTLLLIYVITAIAIIALALQPSTRRFYRV